MCVDKQVTFNWLNSPERMVCHNPSAHMFLTHTGTHNTVFCAHEVSVYNLVIMCLRGCLV